MDRVFGFLPVKPEKLAEMDGKEFATRSTSSETMDASPIILRENDTFRLTFCPSWVATSDHPLHGGFKWERKGKNDHWEEVKCKSALNLKKQEEFAFNLDSEEISKLLCSLDAINSTLYKYGHSFGRKTYQTLDEGLGKILVNVGNGEDREKIIEALRSLEKDNFSSINDVIMSVKIDDAIKFLEDNMSSSDESAFQEYLEANSWIFQLVFSVPVQYIQGETYVGGKKSSGRNGKGGVATDFLLQNSANGSYAVVEIKTPSTELVGKAYRGDGDDYENRCYEPSSDLGGAIVQLENQINVANTKFLAQLGDEFSDLNQLDPLGVLLVGNFSNLDSKDKQKSFNLYRKNSKRIIMTYDELILKLGLLKGIYE